METNYSKPIVRVMIVDDEINARNRLVDLLSDLAEHYPTKVVAEAQNGIEALKKLETVEVDIVLCDISMPEMDGLEFARHVKYHPQAPHVIFVTAYDDYAVKAFEVNAIDYLVKPVRVQRLLESFRKVEQLTAKAGITEDFPNQQRRYFSCVELGRILLVPVHKVCYIKADDKYVQAVTHERDYWLNETLGGIEKEFSDIFLRAHRGYLVSKKYITGLEKNLHHQAETPYSIRLEKIELPIPVSRRQWAVVKDYMKTISTNSGESF